MSARLTLTFIAWAEAAQHERWAFRYVRGPTYQKLVVIGTWVVGGVLLLGSLLDAIANAFTVVTPIATYVGTALLLTGAIATHLVLKRHPLEWQMKNGLIRLNGLGPRPVAILVGFVVLLWVPRTPEFLRGFTPAPAPKSVVQTANPPPTSTANHSPKPAPKPETKAPTTLTTDEFETTGVPSKSANPRRSPSKKAAPRPPLSEGIRLSQKEIASPWNSDAPYAVQGTIQTDELIQNVHLQIECDAPIERYETRLADETIGLIAVNVRVLDGLSGPKRVYEFTLATPAFAPEMPIVVKLGSTQPIRIVGLFHPSVGGR